MTFFRSFCLLPTSDLNCVPNAELRLSFFSDRSSSDPFSDDVPPWNNFEIDFVDFLCREALGTRFDAPEPIELGVPGRESVLSFVGGSGAGVASTSGSGVPFGTGFSGEVFFTGEEKEAAVGVLMSKSSGGGLVDNGTSEDPGEVLMLETSSSAVGANSVASVIEVSA